MPNRGAQLLKAWRTRKGLTQQQAAIQLGLYLTQYNSLERGHRLPGRKASVKALVIAGVPVPAWDEEPKPEPKPKPERKLAVVG